MTSPDFDRMTKDEVIAWFESTDDLSPLIATLAPATEEVAPSTSDTPMVLASIRLPVVLIEQLDSLADLDGTRRSDIIRQALAAYVAQRSSPVARDEAEHALDVLRRLVDRRATPPGEAA